MALCTAAAANRSPYVVNLIPIAEGEEDCRQGINKESLTRRKTIGFCSACYLSRSVQFAMQSSTMHMPMDWWVGEEGRRRGIPHVRYSTTDDGTGTTDAREVTALSRKLSRRPFLCHSPSQHCKAILYMSAAEAR